MNKISCCDTKLDSVGRKSQVKSSQNMSALLMLEYLVLTIVPSFISALGHGDLQVSHFQLIFNKKANIHPPECLYTVHVLNHDTKPKSAHSLKTLLCESTS